jgi:hypothetical protein
LIFIGATHLLSPSPLQPQFIKAVFSKLNILPLSTTADNTLLLSLTKISINSDSLIKTLLLLLTTINGPFHPPFSLFNSINISSGRKQQPTIFNIPFVKEIKGFSVDDMGVYEFVKCFIVNFISYP